jgi:soluble cytochrome b562
MKIGIVSEGISDYWVLKHIVEIYLKDLEAYTIPLKPKQKNNKQEGFGTWQGVLEYVAGNDLMIKEAVAEDCVHIIIQIDTDVSNEYGVPFNEGTDTHESLFENVKALIDGRIHTDIKRDIIIYAICIQTLECWLIPFVCNNVGKCSKINNCIATLNNEIQPQNKHINEAGDKNSQASQNAYQFILNKKRKAKDIEKCSKYNIGFQKFIEQLDKIREEKEKIEPEITE